MSQENPYAVSELYTHAHSVRDGLVPGDPGRFVIEAPFIVCGRRLELPQVCVLSGETDDLVPARRFAQMRSWKFEIFRSQCEVSFFLSRRIRRRLRYRFCGGFLLSAASIVMGIAGAASWWPAIWVFGASTMFFVGAWIHSQGSVPLVISRKEGGKQFWLSGFSPKFFESLRRVATVEPKR